MSDVRDSRLPKAYFIDQGKYKMIQEILNWLYEYDNVSVTDWFREMFEDELRRDY